jgi:hypothetical protein
MEPKAALPGSGYFQWNAGGWFGSQLGGTLWMLVGAMVILPHAPEVAGIWSVCFAVANTIGSWTWSRRDRFRPYPAIQALLLACGVSGLLACAALHLLRPGLRITRPAGVELADEPRLAISLLVVCISLMTWFHVMEWTAKKQRARSEGQPRENSG